MATEGRHITWTADDRRAIRVSICPVLCGYCGLIYDLGTVRVTGRYEDATTWYTPCCGEYADDHHDDNDGWWDCWRHIRRSVLAADLLDDEHGAREHPAALVLLVEDE